MQYILITFIPLPNFYQPPDLYPLNFVCFLLKKKEKKTAIAKIKTWSIVFLSAYSCMLALTWSVFSIPNITHLKKNYFPYTGRNQMPKFPQLAVELSSCLPLPWWDFTYPKLVQILCKLSPSHGLICASNLLYLEMLSLASSTTSSSYSPSTSSSTV